MNSFIGWIGGKRALRKQILDLFPEQIGRYIEVFGGAGWVLFAKDKLCKALDCDISDILEYISNCDQEKQ